MSWFKKDKPALQLPALPKVANVIAGLTLPLPDDEGWKQTGDTYTWGDQIKIHWNYVMVDRHIISNDDAECNKLWQAVKSAYRVNEINRAAAILEKIMGPGRGPYR